MTDAEEQIEEEEEHLEPSPPSVNASWCIDLEEDYEWPPAPVPVKAEVDDVPNAITPVGLHSQFTHSWAIPPKHMLNFIRFDIIC